MKFKSLLKSRTAMIAASAVLSTAILGSAFVGSIGQSAPAYASTSEMSTIAPHGTPSFREIAKKVTPAVVNISTTMKAETTAREFGGTPFPQGSPFEDFFKRFFGDQFEQFDGRKPNSAPGPKGHALGSGFIIDADGHVVTNNHVIENAEDIVVILNDGTELKAELVGADPKTDLAVLKVKSDKPLTHVNMGDSDKIEVGDWVLAVGNPFGLGGSVTAGIVSARGRDLHSGPFDDFLQIDAAINRGNSGGPSFNEAGEVIGVNSAIYSPNGGNIGIGFAIPSNMAKDIVATLIEHGSIERGWLGVSIQPVTEDIADSLGLKDAHGALVASVQPDSPAAKAGLQAGDVILSFDGQTIDEMKTLPRVVAKIDAGTKAKLSIWRDGGEKTLRAQIGKQHDEAQVASASVDEPSDGASLGIVVAGLSDQVRSRYGIPETVKGVLVVDVKNDGPAAEKGIQAGDVIAKVGNKAVTTPDQVRAEVRGATLEGRKAVLLLVNRHGEERFVAISLRSA